MSGWVTCEKHHSHYRIPTSPKFFAAVKNNESISQDDIRRIQINSQDGSYQYAVDVAFFEQCGFRRDQSVVLLHNRDKSSGKLNDRVLIVRICRETIGVCRFCLDEALTN